MAVALAKPDSVEAGRHKMKFERYKSCHSRNVYIFIEMYMFFVSESLTYGYQMISNAETFIMNTDDKEIHLLLTVGIQTLKSLRIKRIEALLKDAGFTVPPMPASKILQGKPGVGQEVKLSDDEVLRVMHELSSALLNQDVRAVGTATTMSSIRNLFVELLKNDIIANEAIFKMGTSRQVFPPPPPATSSSNPLNMGEVFHLWSEMNYRQIGIIELEIFLNSTNDTELKDELEYAIQKISYPQLKKMEKILKSEGFTVPIRPQERTKRQPEGISNQILLSDNEIIEALLSSTQIAMNHHIRALTGSFRVDIRKLLKECLMDEIDNLERVLKLAIKRKVLKNPPYVTSKQG
jgi:hypothetical protein